MAHKISWLVDKRIILIDYLGDVDKLEVNQINDELERFRLEGQKPIHIISDHRKMGQGRLTLRDTFINLSTMKKFGWGWTIMIAPHQMIRFFAEVFATRFGVKIREMPNREDALEMLIRYDLSLHRDLGQS